MSGLSGFLGGLPFKQSAHGQPSDGSALAACAVGLGFPAPFGVLPAVAFSPSEAALRTAPKPGFHPLLCDAARFEVSFLLCWDDDAALLQPYLIFGNSWGSGPACSAIRCVGSSPGGGLSGVSRTPSMSCPGAKVSDEANRCSSSCLWVHRLLWWQFWNTLN